MREVKSGNDQGASAGSCVHTTPDNVSTPHPQDPGSYREDTLKRTLDSRRSDCLRMSQRPSPAGADYRIDDCGLDPSMTHEHAPMGITMPHACALLMQSRTFWQERITDVAVDPHLDTKQHCTMPCCTNPTATGCPSDTDTRVSPPSAVRTRISSHRGLWKPGADLRGHRNRRYARPGVHDLQDFDTRGIGVRRALPPVNGHVIDHFA